MHDRKRPPKLRAGDFVTPTVRLVRLLAEGGMGKVWIAEHLGLKARVVVKLMAEEMAARDDGAERFAREAAAAAAIKSPHVVQVFDHGTTSGGIPYIVMELLEGRDLGAELAERGRLSPEEVVAIVVQVGKALSRAHKAGIVHRDIKPDNIFLCDASEDRDVGRTMASAGSPPEMFVKLLDFGTAKKDLENAATRTTAPGQIMGTPYYMSPEQSVGTEADERSDIWSLGVVAFEALTGKKPFDGGSIGAITIAIHGAFPKISELAPELPAALESWFETACAQAPTDRFPTVRAAIDAFVEAVTGIAPNDQPTESIVFSRVPSEKRPPSIEPVSLSPLLDSLPRPGAERRFPTIAAGVVMTVAALAMGGILLRRSPPSPAPSGLVAASTPPPPSPPSPAKAPAADLAPPPPSEPPFEPEPTFTAPAPIAPPPVASTATLSSPPVLHAPKTSRPAAHARSKKAPPPAASSVPSREDEDLVRIRNAAAKHGAPGTAPAPSSSSSLPPALPSSTTPAPSPVPPSNSAPAPSTPRAPGPAQSVPAPAPSAPAPSAPAPAKSVSPPAAAAPATPPAPAAPPPLPAE